MSSIGFSFPVGGGSGVTPDLEDVTLIGNSTPTGLLVTNNYVRAVNNLTPNLMTAFMEGGAVTNKVEAGVEAVVAGASGIAQFVGDTSGLVPVASWELKYDLFRARFTLNSDTAALYNSVFNFRQAVANPTRDVAFVDELRPYPTRQVNVNFTVLVTDGSIEVDATAGTITGTLPTNAALAGYVFAVKLSAKIGAFVCILSAAALIDGAPTYTITLLNGGAFIQYTGTTWIVLATKN